MRIFSAVRHALDPDQFYGELWSANFHPALQQLGHEVIVSQADLLPLSRFMSVGDEFTSEELEARAQTTQLVLDEVQAALRLGPVDLFLGYFYNAHFDPAGFAELSRLGIPSVNFYCNSTHQFDLVKEIAESVDFAWHTESDSRDDYLAVGANPIHVQMAADPHLYSPRNVIQRVPSAVFVGQRYADREVLLMSLIDAMIPIDIYGAGWREDEDDITGPVSVHDGKYLGRQYSQPGHWNSYVDRVKKIWQQHGVWDGSRRLFELARYRHSSRRNIHRLEPFAKGRAKDLNQVFSNYALSLNFSNVWADGRPGSELIPHVRLRDFEAPMCGACYLTGHCKEIEEYYDIGREIDTYKSAEELVEKSRFYLDHPKSMERLRSAGHSRALRDHTWVNRFQELFSKLDLE